VAQRRIPIAEPALTGHEKDYVAECLETNWISSKGRFIPAFEDAVSAFVGVPHGCAVSSGTAALHVALAAMDVRRGDEVIVPTFTMISCANAVTYLGGRLVLVDSETDTWNLDPDAVRMSITPRTKVIMPVHLYGHPADLDPVLESAAERGAMVLEDAAEALGAEYRGRKVGGIGDASALSFYANKVITTGEGGMVVTRNAVLADKCKSLRDQAYDQRRRAWLEHTEVGFNYRLTNIQAAIGLAQTEQIEHFVDVHRRIAREYESILKGVPGVVLPPAQPWAKNAYWMYTILVEAGDYGMTRNDLMSALQSRGIDCRSTFVPIHRQLPYRDQSSGREFPVADSLSARGINLPSGNSTTPEQVRDVAETIASLSRR
jgi:perosamine synthetase